MTVFVRRVTIDATAVPGAEVLRPDGLGHIPMSDDALLVARLFREVTDAVDRPAEEAKNG